MVRRRDDMATVLRVEVGAIAGVVRLSLVNTFRQLKNVVLGASSRMTVMVKSLRRESVDCKHDSASPCQCSLAVIKSSILFSIAQYFYDKTDIR